MALLHTLFEEEYSVVLGSEGLDPSEPSLLGTVFGFWLDLLSVLYCSSS